MYNPRYDGFGPSFPELDDPHFWAHIASQVDVPYQQSTLEYWQIPQQTGFYPNSENEQGPLPYGSRLLLPAPSNRSNPSPATHDTGASRSEKIPSMTWLIATLAVLACIVLFASVRPQQPQRMLVRLSQLDQRQYADAAEYNTWSASACSATTMTEVLNFYKGSGTYRITDILEVEIHAKEISESEGLLHGVTSIQNTVAPFGFKATQLDSPSLDEVIKRANDGEPVVVSFPPQTWGGGHILLVRGGNATTVDLTDSSQFDMQEMTRSRFLTYWRSFAVIIEAQ